MYAVETPTSATVEPKPRRWSKAEFYRMAEWGWFKGQRAELVNGEIVVLSRQKFLHASTTDLVTEVLRSRFGAGFWVRMQLPLDIGQASLPEPDVSIVAGAREDYTDHPQTALLVVEVSDSTLAFDRGPKALDYAASGIADYWIINRLNHQIEVHRAPSNGRYDSPSIYLPGDSISPLALPPMSIAVTDLLPR